MRVVVVGGGFGGLASATRLAKLGHEVTLVSPDLGGALRPVEQDGFTWDTVTTALLPAVLRDLFRKSGRPLERELDLVEVPVIRSHRFPDGSTLDVPGGSRAAQLAALGEPYVDYVASYGETWELLRRHVFEAHTSAPPREVTDLLRGREMLHRRLRASFRDSRLRQLAGHPFELAGHALRDVPAWAGLTAYLEQRFGAWRPEGGMAALAERLVDRLATRGVTVVGQAADDLLVRAGRVAAVRTGAGELDADAVVVAVDPRRLASLASYTTSTMPAIPPAIVHLGLTGEVPDLPAELVLHGDPMLVVRPTSRHSWTVLVRGRLQEDVLVALARHRVDVRKQVVSRVDLSPADLVRRWRGSPAGVRWQGRSTRRLGPLTPIPGVYAAGAHAVGGDGLPFVGLSAALVAAEIGPA
ncbi:phytoene desaturase family protein [Nocardioides sp.]|uniref:phytoene desaturase family protein n=1 Tax=Nocardioides sp. TaxID=35761 RepID=UPI0039E470DA